MFIDVKSNQRRNQMDRRRFFGAMIGFGAVGTVKATSMSKDKKDKYVYTTGIGNDACDLVRALGLDPNKTQSVHLMIDVDDVIHADVRQMVTTEDIKKVIAVVDKRYVLCHFSSETDKLIALRSGE